MGSVLRAEHELKRATGISKASLALTGASSVRVSGARLS